MDTLLTSAAQTYIKIFSSYLNQLLIWGQWLFGALLVINMGWLWFWYATDKDNVVEGLSDFLKKFFMILLFYTIMVNHHWLLNLLTTTQVMGQKLTGIPIDPSSVIANGIMIANKILIPLQNSSLLTSGFGLLLGFIVYLFIVLAFISIALDLALTLIMATALISLSTFFLGFAALGATSQIARQSLMTLLGLCIKLLGIYLVVGAGSKTIATVAAAIPIKILAYDAYIWVIASVALFWLLARNLPGQIARIVTDGMQDNLGTNVPAFATGVLKTAYSLKQKKRANSNERKAT